MSSIYSKLIREPLLHFVLLGAIIFALFGFFKTDTPSPEKIIITRGDITSMVTGFLLTRQRPPTHEELEGLINERVKQEVYRREAVALGLDKDDIIIQRRLQQKLEFIVNDNAVEENPGDAELQEFLNNHSADFREEPHFTFRQVFLDPARHGIAIEKDALRILANLNNGAAGFKKLSDPSLLPSELFDARETEVSGEFGSDFLLQISKLPVGKWEGPVQSTYGYHLVQITAYKEAHTPLLADIRDAVVREWNSNRILETNEIIYQKLLKNYTVTIESNEP